jgi:hypothetical protein
MDSKILYEKDGMTFTKIDDKNLSVTFFLPNNKSEPFAFGTQKK